MSKTTLPSQTFVVSESHGLDRVAEPVSVTASFYAEELPGPSALRLLDDRGAPVTVQVTDFSESPSTGQRTRPSRHGRVHFLADVPARARRRFRLDAVPARDGPAQDAQPGRSSPSGLSIKGEGLSVRVENENLTVTLDPASGQLLALGHKPSGVTLDSPRTVHWNPDFYDPNRGWPHPFDWNPPPKVTYERGPIFFELYRSGTLKEFPEITLHILYRLYAGASYLWVRTLVEVTADVPLVCLRNDEMVFKEDYFTHLAWQASDGRVSSRPLASLEPINRHGDVLKVGPETPWLAFAHLESGHAAATLRLRGMNFNRLGRPLRLRDHASYLVRSESLHGVYWVRPLIYWPYHAKRDQLLVATAGSCYLEENAYALAASAPSGPEETASRLWGQFSNLRARLTHPLHADVEDELTEKIRA